MTISLITADVLQGLAVLPDQSVHCVVTSPPYWGLRDYGVAGQIGLEPTFQLYVSRMVEVFREVRRVLRDDGTLWVNLGDSYAGHNLPGWRPGNETKNGGVSNKNGVGYIAGLKPKDLLGIPWRVAFALQDDGWYLRSDIIWAKPNPMPESVTDRPTKSHEYVFLLAKAERYYYDGEAIKEPASALTRSRGRGVTPKSAQEGSRIKANSSFHAATRGVVTERNKRSVWTVATAPFSQAHFATFPPKLVEPMIKAGCPVGGTVLDPFCGAGTTLLVADRLQRNAIGIEINPEYAAMANERMNRDRGGLLDIMEACPTTSLVR
jgi:DNA modification methylase